MPRDTREKILEAGLKLFSEKGFLGATTREISQLAGVAELTLFRHFSTKERLFEEMINRYSFLPALRGLLPSLEGVSYRTALSEIAGKFLVQLQDRRDLVRIMMKEMYLYPAQIRTIYHNFIDVLVGTLASYFRRLQEEGALRAFNPEAAARAFLGMFFSYFCTQEILMLKYEGTVDSETIIREYVDIFVSGTGGLTAGRNGQERQKRRLTTPSGRAHR